MMSLPQGWSLVSLNDIALKEKGSMKRGPFGGSIKKEIFVADGYKVYEQKNAIENNFEIGNYFIDENKYQELIGFKIQPNDLIISCAGTIGKVAIVPENAKQGIINQALMKISPNQEIILPRYLKWFLESPIAKRDIFGQIAGTAIKNLAAISEIKKSKIPLPPLEEQKRIVAILDKADEIRQKRKRAIALTEELLKSTFLDMFGDPMINPKGWEVVKIGNITEVKTGKTPSREQPENYGGKIRWIKTTEVRGNIIYDTEEKLTEKGASQMTIFPKDSIIVAMYGQGITRGRSAILAVSCTTNQACAVILPNYQKYIPVYLWTFLQLCYQQLRDLGRGSNQPNLNLNMMKNFDVPLPPIELQNKFSDFVDHASNLKQKYIDASIESENLFNSLLQRAFKGEL